MSERNKANLIFFLFICRTRARELLGEQQFERENNRPTAFPCSTLQPIGSKQHIVSIGQLEHDGQFDRFDFDK
jgi:hypothetical protein